MSCGVCMWCDVCACIIRVWYVYVVCGMYVVCVVCLCVYVTCVCCVSVYNVCVVYVSVGMYMVYVYGVWYICGVCGMSVCICNMCVVRLFVCNVCVLCLSMCMYVVCVCGVCGESMWNVGYVEVCMWYVRECVSEWEVCGKDTLFLIQKSSWADHYTTNRKNSCCLHKSFPGGSQPLGSGVSTAPSCPSDSLHFLGLGN